MFAAVAAAVAAAATVTVTGLAGPDTPAPTAAAPVGVAADYIGAPTSIPVPGGGIARIHTGAPGGHTVLGNLTVVNPAGGGHTVAYPCNEPRPLASNNNYTTGQTIPNFHAVKADPAGDICVYTSTTTHLLWDQVAETTTIKAGTPQRRVDTRGSGFPALTAARPKAGVIATVNTGAPGRVVFGNLTVTQPAAGGFTTAYPCNQPRPLASNNNYVAGQTIPNFVAVKSDSDGNVCLYSSQDTHLIFDQVATSDTLPVTAPQRIVDTRKQSGVPLPAGTESVLHIGEPNSTVVGTLTATASPTGGWLATYPCAEGRPLSSSNNFPAGRSVPNFIAVKSDDRGNVCVYNSAPAHFLFDQVGVLANLATHSPARLLDTRDRDTNNWAAKTAHNGQPVTWDMCRAEIPVRINPAGSTQGAAAAIIAIERARATSGLPFVYKGFTTVVPTKANNYGYDLRAGSAVIISFTTPAQTDLLPAGRLAGTYQHYSRPATGAGTWLFAGTVVNSEALNAMTFAQRQTVLSHELGHIVGLRDSSDPRQVMNPDYRNTSGLWGNGDRTGLTALGRPATAVCTTK